MKLSSLAGVTQREVYARVAAARVVRVPDRSARSADRRATLLEKRAQHRAVAMRLVLAIAADREISLVGERGEEVEGVPRRRLVHLGAEAAQERLPFLRRPCRLGARHEIGAGRKIGVPDVEPVIRGIALLAHPPR